jgi:hypothetical protein
VVCPFSSVPGRYGQLTITGSTPGTGIIAILFSAGAVVGSQVRDVANENSVANYLENGNETGIATNTFVSGQSTDSFNDRLFAITSDALFPVVEQRVIRDIRQSLLNYRTVNGYFPYASSYASTLCSTGNTQGRVPLTIVFLLIFGCTAQNNWGGGATLPSWFSANNWHELLFYAVSSDCISVAGIALCNSLLGSPLTVGTASAQALLISAGRTLSGQIRPCPDTSSVPSCAPHYLDNVTANTDGNSTFTMPVASATNNDQLLIVSP